MAGKLQQHLPTCWLDNNDVESVRANLGMAKKVTNSKKSTIFVLSSWNLVKITNSWGSHFDQVSWE